MGNFRNQDSKTQENNAFFCLGLQRVESHVIEETGCDLRVINWRHSARPCLFRCILAFLSLLSFPLGTGQDTCHIRVSTFRGVGQRILSRQLSHSKAGEGQTVAFLPLLFSLPISEVLCIGVVCPAPCQQHREWGPGYPQLCLLSLLAHSRDSV